MKKISSLFRPIVSITLGCALFGAGLSGCGGGGGGGGDFIGAAIARISASPQRIDSGDRTEVRIQISELHKNGISLKIRYPKGLEYIPGSSFLDVAGSDIDVSPTVNQEKDSLVYLVYYIAPSTLGRSEQGTLYFELEGTNTIKDGAIEVDPDVDDPRVDNASEFNIEDPQFGAEGEVSIRVTD